MSYIYTLWACMLQCCFLSILVVSFPRITSQPLSQRNIPPGMSVTFAIQATGTQPLNYQWQWKQFGKKGEKDGWQNLSGQGSTFQVMGVRASNAGYYQCVVSNSTGSETSQLASLTVGKHVSIVRHCKHINKYLLTNCCLSCAQFLSYVTLMVNCMRFIGYPWASTLGLHYQN